MDSLRALEHESVFIIREAYSRIDRMAMLWSMGKDSTALLWLVREAFLRRVPFPLIHIDTTFKIPEMIDAHSPQVGGGSFAANVPILMTGTAWLKHDVASLADGTFIRRFRGTRRRTVLRVAGSSGSKRSR